MPSVVQPRGSTAGHADLANSVRALEAMHRDATRVQVFHRWLARNSALLLLWYDSLCRLEMSTQGVPGGGAHGNFLGFGTYSAENYRKHAIEVRLTGVSTSPHCAFVYCTHFW